MLVALIAALVLTVATPLSLAAAGSDRPAGTLPDKVVPAFDDGQ